jgi:DNA-binding response OmpR family regulator
MNVGFCRFIWHACAKAQGKNLKMKNGGQKQVFLIEDDYDIRSSIVELLEEEGIPIEWADNGEEAMKRLLECEEKPSLILLDLRLPVKDGFQFRKEQKAHPDLAGIPIVVLSADGKLKEKSEILGARGILKKPVDVDELLATVRKNLH